MDIENDVLDENELVKTQMKLLAKRLRFERQKRRISQIDLSFQAGLSQNQVSSIETGKICPTAGTIFKICNALNINPAVLFDVEDAERSQAKEIMLDLVSRFM
jgi:transcriptional regulator with XRE-family HTH domain